jgi:hypothetical protein
MASINEVEAIFVTALLAAAIAVWGIITQRVVSRRLATLDYFSRVDNDRDIVEARKLFVKLTSEGYDLMAIADPSKYDTEEAGAMRLILNENEKLAIGIQFGILDKEFVKRAVKGTVIRDWQLSAPFVYKVRAATGRDMIYHEFEELARVLSDNRKPQRSSFWRLWF